MSWWDKAMGIKVELEKQVAEIFATRWEKREGLVVPEPEAVRLGNDAVEINATVLYADLAESTVLVDRMRPEFAAEVYKAYLVCATRLIRDEGGSVTAFDGDRVMGIFIGDSKNTSAARCALRINGAVIHVINPKLKAQYPDVTYEVRHAVGIDTSRLLAARTGIRGSNDLVWVGRAANYAAKLCSLRDGDYATWITREVFDVLPQTMKVWSDGRAIWEPRLWTARGNFPISRSNWWFAA